jgi:hypothetical protein
MSFIRLVVEVPDDNTIRPWEIMEVLRKNATGLGGEIIEAKVKESREDATGT